jgi:2,4-dienoyl-CoA reductase-like NADH-dependent reductase (Old Yellow Enzyme family)/thioredoxin reductase
MEMTGLKVLEPIEINGMRLKNRLGFAPMLNMPHGENSCADEKTVRWFEERAKSGLGLIMTGALQPMDPPFPLDGIGIWSDAQIEGLSRVADAVHAHGSKLGVQLAANGPLVSTAPSPGPYPDPEHPPENPLKILRGFEAPTFPLTVEQILEMEDGIAAAAANVRAAGADCVQLHCAHGGATLHCAFISSYYNRREDEYGGSWENRLRFPVETLEKMRRAVGPDYPILVRLSADQLVGDRGITLEDTTHHIVPALEAAGVDCFDISQGDIMRAPEGVLISMYYRRGCFIHLAEAVKKVTQVPVIGVGRIVDVDMAETFLQEDKADIIYMGRQFTADTDTFHKYLDGRKDEIRTCLACSEECGTPCSINYSISPEARPLTPAERPKHVLVIGGGVAGMEAARVCRLRGHRVTLLEKEPELGGMVAALALTPTTGELGNIVKYLGVQMRKLEVDVRVCKEATPADVEELKPDAVILAAGASLQMPEIAQGKPWVMNHFEALKRMPAIGQRVVIWGLVATDLAISLAEMGKDVVLLGRGDVTTLDKYCSMSRRWHAFRKLSDIPFERAAPEAQRLLNPEVLFHTQVKEVRSDEVDVVDENGVQKTLPYDTLVVSLQRRPEDSLFEQLQEKVPEVHKIGDRLNFDEGTDQSANIQGAIWSANEVALTI